MFGPVNVTGASVNFLAGLTASSDGHLVAMRGASASGFPSGLHVEVWSRSGTQAWSVDRPSELEAFGSRGTNLASLAAGPENEFAVAGAYASYAGTFPLIARFSAQ